jgi:2,5-dihydroxypyridine 5,6-dioxygenase
MSDQSFLTDLCTDYLSLCAVDEDQTVAILSEGHTRLNYADAFLSAAPELGANSYHVRRAEPLPTGAWDVGNSGLAQNRDVVEAAKQADILVDLVFLLFSKEQMEIQEAGTRIALAVEPVELLARLFPTRELRERVEAAAERLAAAKTMRITSADGTDVTYRLGVYPTIIEYGYR